MQGKQECSVLRDGGLHSVLGEGREGGGSNGCVMNICIL